MFYLESSVCCKKKQRLIYNYGKILLLLNTKMWVTSIFDLFTLASAAVTSVLSKGLINKLRPFALATEAVTLKRNGRKKKICRLCIRVKWRKKWKHKKWKNKWRRKVSDTIRHKFLRITRLKIIQSPCPRQAFKNSLSTGLPTGHSSPDWNHFVQKTKIDKIGQIWKKLTVFISSHYGALILSIFRIIFHKIKILWDFKVTENSSFYLKSRFFLSTSNHILSAGHDLRKFAQSNAVSPDFPYN